MSREIQIDGVRYYSFRSCSRCVSGVPHSQSEFCVKCLAHYDRIIERAMGGWVEEDELANMLGVNHKFLQNRRLKIRRALQSEQKAA